MENTLKTIFYSKDAQFELTGEEFEKALSVWNKGQHCFIQRLGVSLSHLYIWAGQKPATRKQNRDKQWCIKKYDNWVLERDNNIKVDLSYYPELENNDSLDKLVSAKNDDN